MNTENKKLRRVSFLNKTLPLMTMALFVFLLPDVVNAQTTYTFTNAQKDYDWNNSKNWEGGKPASGPNTNIVIQGTCNYNGPAFELGKLLITGELNILNLLCTLKVNSHTSVMGQLDNAGRIEIGGNVDIQGPVAMERGTIVLNGNSTQSITMGGVANMFYNLEIDNSSLGISILLLDHCTIGGTLELTDGTINTNGNILEMTSVTGADLIGGSDTSFIIATSVAGSFRRHIEKNNDTYVFPVGLSAAESDYYKMELENNQLETTSYLDVFMVRNNGTYENHSGSGNAYHEGTKLLYYCDEEWSMNPDTEPTGGSFNLTLYIDNLNVGLGGTLQDNKYTIVKRPSASQDFAHYDSFEGSTTIPADGVEGRMVKSGYAKRSGFTSFSKATVAGSNDPLPIKLLEFNAEANQESLVALSWTTASELNNDFFTIERSRDGVDYEVMLDTAGAGTSNQILHYNAIDDAPYEGLSYYRLKQTDYDGKYEYSKLVAVNISKPGQLSIYPNPAKDHIKVDLGDSYNDINVQIESISGQKALAENHYSNGQTLTIDIKDLKPGIYFLRLFSQEKNEVFKFIKAK